MCQQWNVQSNMCLLSTRPLATISTKKLRSSTMQGKAPQCSEAIGQRTENSQSVEACARPIQWRTVRCPQSQSEPPSFSKATNVFGSPLKAAKARIGSTSEMWTMSVIMWKVAIWVLQFPAEPYALHAVCIFGHILLAVQRSRGAVAKPLSSVKRAAYLFLRVPQKFRYRKVFC